jgi:soluble lytic murein transglycosylase-like protein
MWRIMPAMGKIRDFGDQTMPSLEAMPAQPVTIECMVAASRAYRLPIEILAGVMAQERGKLGRASRNRDGSWDMGPMQINSRWLKTFAPYGVDARRLMYDGCAKVAVGAWILRYEQGRAGGDLWTAVGRYHSPDARRARGYAWKVSGKIADLTGGGLSLNRLVQEANQ